MTSLSHVMDRARARRPRFALVSGGESTMPDAARCLAEEGLGEVTLIGAGGIDPSKDKRLSVVASVLRDRWSERVRDGIHALDLAADPLLFGAGLVARGEFDVCLAGPATPIDGLEEAVRWVVGPDRALMPGGSVGYLETADQRLVALVTPDTAGPVNSKGMARLALAAANHRSRVVGEAPRVAFLVAPPAVDASHADAELALAEFVAIAPGVAAAVEWSWPTAQTEDPTGRFRSRPNVLIFPDATSGHLAQLILRDASGVRTWGPLFPGERWGFAGVLEGAEVSDILARAALAAAGLAAPSGGSHGVQ
jgi:phosphotransacetylase